MNHWTKAISKSERGEVGRVYFVNTEITKGEIHITQNKPFTLNPDYGSTIEEMLKRSDDIPRQAKSDLLSQRLSNMVLSNGTHIRIWISEEAAPDSEALKAEEQAKRPVLYGADGRRV